jgi:hypothetical protein
MRLVVAGGDDEGNSVVISDRSAVPRDPSVPPEMLGRAPEEVEAGSRVSAELWASDVGLDGPSVEDRAPVRRSSGSERDPAYAAFDLPRGSTRWMVFTHGPNSVSGLHWTETTDCVAILSGEIDLVLDRATVRLGAGDVAVICGVNHGWNTGSAGCTVSTVMVGTKPVG